MRLFLPLVRQRANGGVRWLQKVFVDQPNILDGVEGDDGVEDLRDRLRGELDSSTAVDDEVHPLLVEIAGILGIKEEPEEDVEEMTENVSESEEDEPYG